MHKKCFLQNFPTDTVLCSNYILTRSASWQFGSHISAVDDILLCYPYLRRMYLCILWYARNKKQDNMSLLFPEIYFSKGPGCLQKPFAIWFHNRIYSVPTISCGVLVWETDGVRVPPLILASRVRRSMHTLASSKTHYSYMHMDTTYEGSPYAYSDFPRQTPHTK